MIEQATWNEFQQAFVGDSRTEMLLLAAFAIILIVGAQVALLLRWTLIRYKENVKIRSGFYRDCFGEVLDRKWFVWYTVSISREKITTVIGRWHLKPSRGRFSGKVRDRKLGIKR